MAHGLQTAHAKARQINQAVRGPTYIMYYCCFHESNPSASTQTHTKKRYTKPVTAVNVASFLVFFFFLVSPFSFPRNAQTRPISRKDRRQSARLVTHRQGEFAFSSPYLYRVEWFRDVDCYLGQMRVCVAVRRCSVPRISSPSRYTKEEKREAPFHAPSFRRH